MKNAELRVLIDSIKIEVDDDVKSGNTSKTEYKLPKEAQTEEVIDALINNFDHYKSATVNDGVLTLEHPDKD
ncbi:hypothetical protein K0J45_14020 [Shewanella alkalitolerans]|uniref:hypothetical protein n=1 Tax=Shewanella alkalitolerans TaxID=2864209 RepID=UPI001C65ECA5|nr:hypothetical protein [Shewanella alkalitolerans]QYJ96642.1 hypothetical protein K0J45_14020 [Shewanella alkalitolerans]